MNCTNTKIAFPSTSCIAMYYYGTLTMNPYNIVQDACKSHKGQVDRGEGRPSPTERLTNMLPSPEQTWSHGTVSRDRLETALSHPDITAIEIDILMGYDTTQPQESRPYQAMACHPPQKESDLSVAVFWDRVLCKQHGSPLRHVKLDFKDLDSVRPTLASLRDHLSQRTSRAFRTSATTIFLNADIFPGPGFRGKNAHLHAKSFLELCAQEVCSLTNPMAFSFGFKVDYRILEPYSTIDSDALATLTRSLSSTLPQLG